VSLSSLLHHRQGSHRFWRSFCPGGRIGPEYAVVEWFSLEYPHNPKVRGLNPLPATKDFKDLHRSGVSPFSLVGYFWALFLRSITFHLSTITSFSLFIHPLFQGAKVRVANLSHFIAFLRPVIPLNCWQLSIKMTCSFLLQIEG